MSLTMRIKRPESISVMFDTRAQWDKIIELFDTDPEDADLHMQIMIAGAALDKVCEDFPGQFKNTMLSVKDTSKGTAVNVEDYFRSIEKRLSEEIGKGTAVFEPKVLAEYQRCLDAMRTLGDRLVDEFED